MATGIRPADDVIVCGDGTVGCVIARRLSGDPAETAVLIVAGSTDRVPSVIDITPWMTDIGSERDWGHRPQNSAWRTARTPPLPLGRLLGAGTSIDGSIWGRGHENDFGGWAEAAGGPGRYHEAALAIYRRIEDWHGPTDPMRPGTSGILNIVQPDDPLPLGSSLIDGAPKIGIPPVADINGAAMAGDGGRWLANISVQDGSERVSMAASNLHPVMDRRNLDILP